MPELLPVAQAQERLFAMARRADPETFPLDKAVGRWLSTDIIAKRNQPWADLSAMDGYAICFSDLPGPWHVVGESAAGSGIPAELRAGQAMRIFTGAPMPHGADTVLVQEDALQDGAMLALVGDGPERPGRHVRSMGMDFTQGQTILSAGTRLAAPQIALAALAGHGTVPVRRPIRVTAFSTGNELVPVGVDTTSGQLPCSNGIMLSAMLAGIPVEFTDLGIMADDLSETTRAFQLAADADIIVTTGGASVGDHDLIRPAFAAAGGVLDFWRIAMQPGKPLMAGKLGNAVFMGLPGNPVSAFATATLFLLPLVRHMAGAQEPVPKPMFAILGSDMPATQKRAQYVRGRLIEGLATPLHEQDSGALLALSRADVLIVRPENSGPAKSGERAEILLI